MKTRKNADRVLAKEVRIKFETEEQVFEIKIVPIENYNGEYWISNDGIVYSNKRGFMKQLKPYLLRGYPTVDLYKNDVKTKWKIHRLVALHFIPNPRSLKSVDHINNIKTDNRYTNLRWCTDKENANNPNSNKTKPIMRYTLNDEYIDERSSIQSYVEEFGYNASRISKVAKGKANSSNGYKWKYNNRNNRMNITDK